MAQMTVQIVTPDGLVYDHHAAFVSVKTIDGELGILPRHINTIAVLEVDQVKVRRVDDDKHIDWVAVNGGIIEIADNVIMPKGEVSISVPLKVLRSEDLMTTGAKSFLVKLVDSDDLVAGLRTTLFVTVSDDIPDEWVGDEGWIMNPISQYFGKCSKTKYLFVYEQLGVWDFSSWSYWGMMGDAAKFTPAKRILKEKLAEYEAENGPLVDPKEGRVTFPD